MPEHDNPNSQPILDALDAARREILAAGITSVSTAGRSVAYISLETLDKIEQQERAKQQTGIYANTIRNTPYDSRW